jgi:hypothetical protein
MASWSYPNQPPCPRTLEAPIYLGSGYIRFAPPKVINRYPHNEHMDDAIYLTLTVLIAFEHRTLQQTVVWVHGPNDRLQLVSIPPVVIHIPNNTKECTAHMRTMTSTASRFPVPSIPRYLSAMINELWGHQLSALHIITSTGDGM